MAGKPKIKVEGVPQLLAKFQDRRRRAGGNSEAKVGFKAKYAMYVHESLGMKLAGQRRSSGIGRYWDPQGRAQPRFLTKAMRKLRPEMQDTIKRTLKRGLTLWQALTLHATRVLKEAQKMVPVETGKLKASGYVSTRKK